MNAKLLACHDCDLVQREVQLAPRQQAHCTRCGAGLYRAPDDNLDAPIYLATTAIICFAILNGFTLLVFKLQGRVLENTLLAGVLELQAKGMWLLAALVLLVSIAFPILRLLALLYVLVPLRLHVQTPHAAVIFRFTQALRPWVMVDVYLLGLLVAITKLSQLAEIVPDVALYALVASIVCNAALDAVFDARLVWKQLGEQS